MGGNSTRSSEPWRWFRQRKADFRLGHPNARAIDCVVAKAGCGKKALVDTDGLIPVANAVVAGADLTMQDENQ
jgi:hypothetical protein